MVNNKGEQTMKLNDVITVQHSSEVDRWNRSDEKSQKWHDDMVSEINDLSDVVMEVKGSVSRINGK